VVFPAAPHILAFLDAGTRQAAAIHAGQGLALLITGRSFMKLSNLPRRVPARIAAIDWDSLPPADGSRLRALGFEQGAFIETLHKGMLFWRDPIAVRIGRMTVALRTVHAQAIECEERR
jgi:ferrous iron transport protein A